MCVICVCVRVIVYVRVRAHVGLWPWCGVQRSGEGGGGVNLVFPTGSSTASQIKYLVFVAFAKFN